jgi:hypothetical protein
MDNYSMCEIDARIFVDWTLSVAIPKMTEQNLLGTTDLQILVNGKDYILEALKQMKEREAPSMQ